MASQFEQEIAAACSADPFVPFALVVVGGERYDVQSPDELVSLESIIHHYPPTRDRHNILRSNQLAAIEFLEKKSE